MRQKIDQNNICILLHWQYYYFIYFNFANSWKEIEKQKIIKFPKKLNITRNISRFWQQLNVIALQRYECLIVISPKVHRDISQLRSAGGFNGMMNETVYFFGKNLFWVTSTADATKVRSQELVKFVIGFLSQGLTAALSRNPAVSQ